MRILQQLFQTLRDDETDRLRPFVIIQVILALLMVGVGILLFLIVARII